ncbi:MAG: FAD-dependent thymidylate synthase [Candidatus Omnitrophica bacterium]|nr:FAD-dependent thymidylate synthase [Candidatus Omnitrophota bacterium]MCM8806606.1 FAD-dependent thymidylate synthase [Candidatus Omnitrophota bacterium]
MEVKLLEMSSNPEEIIYASARQCYSGKDAFDIFTESKKIKKEKLEKFIIEIVNSGHESVLEHVKFTFAISGVSRALTHQLVRHRIASYSQQSQRYVNMENFKYIIPPTIKNDKILMGIYQNILEEIREAYKKLIRRFKELGIEGEIANQDARYILPNATETKIIVTMNCRELLNFFKVRCCTRAQWEIRELAYKMLQICKEKLPSVFEKSGAKCEYLGYCPEGEKFTCGKYPVKSGK